MYGCALNPKVIFGTNPLNGLLYKLDMVKGKMDFKKKDVFFKVIDSQIKWGFIPYHSPFAHNMMYDNSQSPLDLNIYIYVYMYIYIYIYIRKHAYIETL